MARINLLKPIFEILRAHKVNKEVEEDIRGILRVRFYEKTYSEDDRVKLEELVEILDIEIGELKRDFKHIVADKKNLQAELSKAEKQIRELREELEKRKPRYEFSNLVEVESDWVVQALTTINDYGNGVSRMPLDSSKYWTTDQDSFDKFLKYNWVNERGYVKARYDCENFATSLKAAMDEAGLTTSGLIIDWSGGHGYNCVVLTDKDGQPHLCLVEPQSDSYWPIEDHSYSGMYELSRADILI